MKCGKGNTWSADEYAIVRANPDLTHAQTAALLPGRTKQSVSNVRARLRGSQNFTVKVATPDQYAVKEPGTYIEMLSVFIVEDIECMEIWCRWNGYSHYEIMSKDRRGWVTLACYAKG